MSRGGEFGVWQWEAKTPVITRVWVEEAGGWIYAFCRDRMSTEIVTAAVFVPSVKYWKNDLPGLAGLALDFDHITHREQPVPLAKTPKGK